MNKPELADDSKTRLVRDFKLVVADAQDLLRATADETGEKFAAARQKLQERLDSAREQLAATEAMVVEKSKQAATATENYVRDNPWKAVGIAAGVGLVVGLLIGRR